MALAPRLVPNRARDARPVARGFIVARLRIPRVASRRRRPASVPGVARSPTSRESGRSSSRAFSPNAVAGDASGSGVAGEAKRLAVFASGGGSNFRAIHDAIGNGKINGSIELVVSDKASCGATEFASSKGIPCVQYPDKEGGGEDKGLGRLMRALGDQHRVDYVLLAGYLKIVPKEVVRRFERGILNIHPALLPSFGGKGCYGMRVHEMVVESGVRFTGATVHFVNEKYDEGRIVAQACVPVYPADSAADVAARVLKSEHEMYPEVVAALCDGRLRWGEDGKPVIWTAL